MKIKEDENSSVVKVHVTVQLYQRLLLHGTSIQSKRIANISTF